MAAAMHSGPLLQRMNLGTPRCPAAESRITTTSSAVIDLATLPLTLSRVNSSHIERTLKGRPSAVVSKRKSSAHTWFGCCADKRSDPAVLVPTRDLFDGAA